MNSAQIAQQQDHPQADPERAAFIAGWLAGFDCGQNATLRLPTDGEAAKAWQRWDKSRSK